MVYIEFLLRLQEIWNVFLGHPKVYFIILGEWLLTVVYRILSGDDESHADVYATGVTLGFVGFELLPFENMAEFGFINPEVIMGFILIAYGAALLVLAATKFLPKTLVNIVGSPGAIAIPTILILIAIHSDVPVDILTILIIAVPIIVIEIIKELRQLFK